MKLRRRPGILGDARQIPRRHIGKNERGKIDEPNQNRVRNHPKNRPFHHRQHQKGRLGISLERIELNRIKDG